MSETSTLSHRPARRLGFYVGAWMLTGSAAVAYLGALSLRPDFAGGLLTRSLGTTDGNQRRIATDQAGGGDGAASISQAEVTRLRNAVGQREAQLKALQMRVAGLQQELEVTRTAAATTAPAAAADNTTADSKAQGKALAVEIVSAIQTPLTNSAAGPALVADVPLPGRRPAQPPLRPAISAPEAALIETGSLSAPATGLATGPVIAKAAKGVVPALVPGKPQAPPAAATKAIAAAPVAFGPATIVRDAPPSPPAVQAGVRLSSGPSVDALRLSWSLMSERYGVELAGLEPRYVSGGNAASPYALIAGPVADKEQAKSLCANLQQKGIPCSVDDYKGNAL